MTLILISCLLLYRRMISSPSRYTSSDTSLSERVGEHTLGACISPYEWMDVSLKWLGIYGSNVVAAGQFPGLVPLGVWLVLLVHLLCSWWLPILGIRCFLADTQLLILFAAPYLPCVSWQGHILSMGYVWILHGCRRLWHLCSSTGVLFPVLRSTSRPRVRVSFACIGKEVLGAVEL